MAAQLMATNGRPARALFWWTKRASISLPVPLSPCRSSGISESMTLRRVATICFMAGLAVTNPSPGQDSRSACASVRGAHAEPVRQGNDVLVVEWLLQIVHRTQLHRPHRRVHAGERRDDHHRRAGLTQVSEEIGAVQVGELQVDEGAVEALSARAGAGPPRPVAALSTR